MKNTLCLILTALLIAFTFTFNSLAQTPQDDPQQGDPQQGDLPDGAEVRSGPEQGRIRDIKFSPDGTRLAVARSRGIWLLDVQTGDELVQFTGFADSAATIAFSPDGNMLVGSSIKDNTVRLWDVHTGRNIRAFKGRSKKNWVGDVAFSPDGKTIVIRRWNKTLCLLDLNTGKTLRIFKKDTEKISRVAFSPDGRTIASSGEDKTVRLWDAHTGKNLHTLTGNTERIWHVAFSPDGKMIASKSNDDTVRLWDTHTGQPLRTIYMSSLGFNFAFSPDSKMIACIGFGTIDLWDVNTGQHLRKLIKTYRRLASTLNIGRLIAFSPDGRMIVSAGPFEVHLWDANTGQLLRKLISHPKGTDVRSFQRN